jgi:hypothetical protein
MRTHLLGAWLAAALMTMLCALAPCAQASATDAGKVRFFKGAESAFDSYVLNPSASTKAWISSHYSRMRAYSTFFDSRTSWYLNAWAYNDAYAIYRGSEAGREQWILKDGQGRRLYIPFGCSGGVCTQYAADIGNPAWRRQWIDSAKRQLAKGYRGIFVDDVNLSFTVSDGAGTRTAPIDPRTGVTMTHDAWQRYFAEFMEQLRDELPAGTEIVQNQVYFHVGLTSPHVRRAIEASTHLEFERGFNDTGIQGGAGTWGYDTVAAWIDYAHSKGKGVIYDVQANWGREYALANYFLYGNGGDSIGMNQGGLPDNWWSGWETDLGAPRGARYEWNGVRRRDFERGTVLVNPPDASTRTLSPGGEWKGLDGAARTSLTLAAREGVVLLRAQSEPPLTVTLSLEPVPAAPSPSSAPAASRAASPKSCTKSKPCPRAKSVHVSLDVKASRRAGSRLPVAVLRGSARGRSGRRARVSLHRRMGGRWVGLRRGTARVSGHGRFQFVFTDLRPGTYRAGVKLPSASRPTWSARTPSVTVQG